MKYKAILKKENYLVVREMIITANTKQELEERILKAKKNGFKLINIEKVGGNYETL